jgi:predicted alpha/beta hydrolase
MARKTLCLMKPRTETVLVSDDYAIAVTHFPAGSNHILICSALAVEQSFYHPIALYFQERGYSVSTFDYRGIGGSLTGSLKGFTATVADWALRDMQGVMQWIQDKFSPTRLFLLGHSLGGKLAGLTTGVKVDALATICTVNGFWKLQPKWEPYKVLFHTSVTFPLTCALFGYMPWSRLAKGCDLPRAAALQWAGWCRRPEYILSDPTLPLHRFADFRAPVLACSISDDPWSTPQTVKALMKAYPCVEFRHLTPDEFGLSRLGHFGLFRRESRDAWGFLDDWFMSQASPSG